jgi:hypothetical protein
VFSFHLYLDGAVVASNQGLTVLQSQAVRELSTRYGSLFEQRRLPQLAREALAAIGAQLFELWLTPSWQKLSARLGLGDQRILVIASDRASVLNLPWELLRPAGGEAIGADAKWSLRRLPWAERQLEAADGELPAGPLKVLYMVSAPQDQAELDFEREEELLLRAVGQAGRRVVFDSGDLGSFEELGERLSAKERRAAHLAAGDFLVELDHADREGELGVSWVVCLLEARAQYLAVGALDKARAATGRISGYYARQGLMPYSSSCTRSCCGWRSIPRRSGGWGGRTPIGRSMGRRARSTSGR